MNYLTVEQARRWRRHHTIALAAPIFILVAGVAGRALAVTYLGETQAIVVAFAAFMLLCVSLLWAPIVRRRIFRTVDPEGHLRSDVITFSLFQFPFGSVMMVNELLDAATGGKLRARTPN